MLSTKANLGLFVTVGTVLFALGLFWVGDRKKVFSRGFEVQTAFERVAGLEPGANVRVAGLDAGEVKAIEVASDPTSFHLRIRLDRKFRTLLRQDSIATIQTDGLVGNKYLEIAKGSEEVPECSDPCIIASMDTFDFGDLMQEARGLIRNTDDAIQSAGNVADNMNRVLGQFMARNEDGKSGAANLSSTVANAQTAMANLADNTEALKHNFLFRGFFNRRGFFSLTEMSPNDYRDSPFAKSKEAKRIWIEGKQLFTAARNGTEDLSAEGRKVLDRSMAEYVAFLPNSPLMIEGYSSEGSAEEKFRKAQQRGILAQTYIQAKFQLNPKYIGAIPLIDTPPPKAGKPSWDGLALVLVPSK